MNSDIQDLCVLCRECFGSDPTCVTSLPAAGGDRKYYRMQLPQGRSVMGVVADRLDEARAFVALSRVFAKNGVNVPEVFAASEDCSVYIVEDLGDTSLFSSLSSPDLKRIVRDTMRMLVRMQTIPAEEWHDKVAFRPMSRRLVMWDLNYFKYEFLKSADVEFDEDLLEDDFESLARDLMSADGAMSGFMMRDCQSRNVMLAPEPYFIDFQGGRLGPCLYDAISFLWQAKAAFSQEFRDEMLDFYAREFALARDVDPQEVLAKADLFALFRTLQVLGAYGFRGLVQKRAHFIESIPNALNNLKILSDRDAIEAYPELKRVAHALVGHDRFFPENSDRKLHIKVFSFSYKKGYPEDLSGNGGGFMFDCRGMHNPGRYDEYKPLTGRDAPVIEFLKDRGEADVFASKAFDMISPSVETYLRRGFSSLQVGFGCTGGRHRSVYCAEAVSHMLAAKYPEAIIELIHREQGIREIVSAPANKIP